MKLLLSGQPEQLVVGHAAPEEVRQSRRELVVAQLVGIARRRRILFDSEQEIGRDEHRFDRKLHGVLEPIVAGAGFELDELDVRAAGRRHTVKVVVDSDTGVGLDDIAKLSRAAASERGSVWAESAIAGTRAA